MPDPRPNPFAPASATPRIGPNPNPRAAKLQDALGLPSWVPNLPEGSYGLPPSMRAPTASEGLQDQLLAAIDSLIQQPAAQVGLTISEVLGRVMQALGGTPNYELGGGPDKQLSLGMMPDFPTRSAFTAWQAARGPIPGRTGVSYIKPREAVARQIPANTFMAGGNLKKGLKHLDEAGLSGKKLDAAIAAGVGDWEDLVKRTDPKMFKVGRQRQLMESGLEGKDFYPLSTKEGMVDAMGGDPLMPPLTSATSSQDFPYGNANKALLVRASHGAGDPIEKAISYGGMGSVQTNAQRILENADFFKQLPPTASPEEAMRAFDELMRTASPQQVETMMSLFGQPKTYNFWQNLRGDPRFFTTDTWGGRGMGFSVYDAKTPVLNKQREIVQGGWVEPQRASQFNQGRVVRPLQQPIGIPTQGGINLTEDVFAHGLAPEYGLTPADAQAAQWLGTMKYFDSEVPYHQRAPYNDQFRWRLEKAGLAPRGPGQPFAPDEWAQLRDYLVSMKTAKGANKVIFGKEIP